MTLTEAKKKSLDEELFDHKYIAYKIALRKMEIQTKAELDENIGGGRSGFVSKPTENVAMKFLTDRRIIYLEQLKSDVERFKACLTEEQKDIFYYRWEANEGNTWEEVGEKIHCSIKTIYRKREKILEKYAMFKGEL